MAALLNVKEAAPAIDSAGQIQAAASTDSQSLPLNICALCGKPVSEKAMQYCLAHQERFGGKIYCYEHQRG